MIKKILCVLCILMCVPAFATEMCARNDTIVIPLDSNVKGTSNGNNAAEATWWAIFSYGRIYGLSTCLSAAEGGKPSGGQGSYTNSDGNMLPQDEALAGRTGQDPDGNDRGYCWCKMTHPASSRWVFHYSSSASRCASACANDCGIHAHYNAALRSGLFGSVGK
ncbi:MAG: hypothetical protein J6J82_00935 [Alphaproteobacteria bacterium]|nr:hypothetical protein [Alphaproteobacteria bacterium]